MHGDAQMAFMHRQPLAKTGVAAALGLLAGAGDLNSGRRQEAQVGRAKDTRRFHEEDVAPGAMGDGVKIEYRDADGRLLTRKEAFRQMSYKFHGHGPKQKKQDKRKKELEELDAQEQFDAAKHGTSAALMKTLSATGQAHMALSGGAVSASRALGSSYVDDLGGGLEKKHRKKR